MSGKTDGVGLSATAIGGILIFAGIRGYSVLAVIENLIVGKPITTGVTIINPLSSSDTPMVSDSNGNGAIPPGGNQGLGLTLASSMYGWEGDEWVALQKLWTRESSWSNTAKNPSSGAYGIPQALPYTKMPKAAWPPDKGGKADAEAQIRWGLTYIKGRYGTPSNAWAHETANSWY
jgi:hypothetical protein